MNEYLRAGPNTMITPLGSTIETIGRAGIAFSNGNYSTFVDSEMLASDMTIAVYKNSIADSVEWPAGAVLEEVCAALRWTGFTIDVIGE